MIVIIIIIIIYTPFLLYVHSDTAEWPRRPVSYTILPVYTYSIYILSSITVCICIYMKSRCIKHMFVYVGVYMTDLIHPFKSDARAYDKLRLTVPYTYIYVRLELGQCAYSMHDLV